jgi:hypothetical protein
VTFAKEKWSITAGQTWHPMFLPENCPGTVNVNAGTPFHPLIRNPQIRISRQLSPKTQLLFFVVEQNNFRNSGFEVSGTEHALMPELDLQMKWSGDGVWTAFTAGYKTLAVPGEFTEGADVEKVSGFHFNGSFKYKLPAVTFSMEGIYGSNLSDLVMLGGTGRSVGDNEFVSLHTASVWTDIHGNNKEGFQPGLFAGYTANMGAPGEVTVIPELSRSEGLVASVFGVSPRIKYLMQRSGETITTVMVFLSIPKNILIIGCCYLYGIIFKHMKTKLGIVAVLFVVMGFGMVHGGSQTMERIAIGLMGTGIAYLLYLLLSQKKSEEQKND